MCLCSICSRDDHKSHILAYLLTYIGGFDIALSISSFDHDGLGRYGDPIDANADIRAMRLAQCLLKPNGLMFMTIPIGPGRQR